MHNQVLTYVSPWSVFLNLFLAGVTLFGLGGIGLGLMERDALGVLGGAFLGLAGGLGLAILGAVLCGVFNLLAPATGGLKVRLKLSEEPTASAETLPESSNPNP